MRRALLLFASLLCATRADAATMLVKNVLCLNAAGRTLVQLPGATQDALIAAVVDSGWKTMRVDFAWELIEPQQGQFDWSLYDAFMNRAQTAGVSVIGVLDYGNRWAAAGATDDRTPPDDPATFAAFARAAAQRFKKKMNAWEIWDQPNRADGSTWKPAPDPVRYAALVQATAAAIRKVDKRTAIVLGSLAPHDDLAATGSDWSFLTTAFGPKRKERRQARQTQAIGFEPYVLPTLAPEHAGGDAYPSMPDQVFHIEDRLNDGKLVRLSEFVTGYGWPTGDGGVTPDLQAAYLVRGAALVLAQEVERVCWAQLADDDAAGGFGLLQPNGDGTFATKPAFAAAKLMATILENAAFAADLTEELELPAGSFGMQFTSTHRQTIIFWSLQDGTQLPVYQPPAGATAVKTVALDGTETPCGRTDVACKKGSDGKWPTLQLTVGPLPVFVVIDS